MDALWADDPGELGPFRLLGRLGSGGMGVVYLGEAEDGRKAAVKVVHAHLTGDRAFRARFAREIAVARQVVGPWTAQVLEADPQGPRPWLATEYVAGPNLEDKVTQDGPLAPEVVTTMAVRLSEALAALHASGVVHRDLKPSNVLLAADGPRLIDFGIARALDATKITHTGHVIGTPAFMSPEQAAGDDAEAPSDVFSLASVVVFAATGSGPFGSTANPVAMLLRISQQEPSTDGLPDTLRPHMQACLARDPAARPTAQQLAQRLRPVEPTIVPAGTLKLTSPFEPPEPVPRAPLVRGNRALQWLLVANGALAVVLVILVILVTGPVPVTRAPAPIAAAGAQPPPASAPVAQVAQIPVGKEVRGLAVTSDGAHVVVQTEEGTRIVDTASRAVSPPIPVGGAFALTPDGSRAYVNAVKAMYVIDIGSEQIVGELPVLEDVKDFVLSPDGGTGYVSFYYRPEVAVVEMATGRVTTVQVPVSGPRIGLSPDGATLYLVSGSVGYQSSDMTVAIDPRTMSVAATIPGQAQWMGFRPDGNEVFLGNSVEFTVVDGRTRRPMRTAKLPDTGNVVIAGATSRDGSYLALADHTVNRIHLVDSTTQVENATVTTDAPTREMAFSPDGRSLYVATKAGTLIVIDTSAVVR